MRHLAATGELPQHDRPLACQHAGMPQLVEHAFDAVRMLVDVFQEQDALVDRRKVRRAEETESDGADRQQHQRDGHRR